MMLNNCMTRVAALCIVALALSIAGCQSTPVNQGSGGLRGDSAGATSSQHAHMITATASLNRDLSLKQAKLSSLQLAPELYKKLPEKQLPTGQTQIAVTRQLAGDVLLDKGPYRLVKANYTTGRIEYRSKTSGMHLSVIVRAPTGKERKDGNDFYITDMFSHVSLSQLAQAYPHKTISTIAGQSKPLDYAFIQVGRIDIDDDLSMLKHLNNMPSAEREREDLLGLRAMIMLKHEQNKNARQLIEQGIVRYPNAPIFYSLASSLFERAKPNDKSGPESLMRVMGQRFSGSQIRKSRQTVEQYMFAR